MKAIYQGIRYHAAEIGGDAMFLVDGPTVSLGDLELIVDPTDDQWNAATESEPMYVYNETDLTTLCPGMYLGLYHGRKHPDEALYEWGSNGPIIGPLFYVHTTYGHHLKFRFTSAEAHDRYFPRKRSGWTPGKDGKPDRTTTWEDDGEFVLSKGLLEYQGIYYGDWSVFIAPDCAL